LDVSGGLTRFRGERRTAGKRNHRRAVKPGGEKWKVERNRSKALKALITVQSHMRCPLHGVPLGRSYHRVFH